MNVFQYECSFYTYYELEKKIVEILFLKHEKETFWNDKGLVFISCLIKVLVRRIKWEKLWQSARFDDSDFENHRFKQI